jgi:hypothetical protein
MEGTASRRGGQGGGKKEGRRSLSGPDTRRQGCYLYFTEQPYGFDPFVAIGFPAIAASSAELT